MERGQNGQHGRVSVQIIKDATQKSLLPRVVEKVLPASTVYTDEWKSYDCLDASGFKHSRVAHKQKVFVSGDVHTNTIEGFWSLLSAEMMGIPRRGLRRPSQPRRSSTTRYGFICYSSLAARARQAR